LIGRASIREWPLTTLRPSIGFVPQDTYLFGESVGGNIAFGLADMTISASAKPPRLPACTATSRTSPSPTTPWSERGHHSSGGQKQRAATPRCRRDRTFCPRDALFCVTRKPRGVSSMAARNMQAALHSDLPPHLTVRDADQIVVLVMEPSPSAHAR